MPLLSDYISVQNITVSKNFSVKSISRKISWKWFHDKMRKLSTDFTPREENFKLEKLYESFFFLYFSVMIILNKSMLKAKSMNAKSARRHLILMANTKSIKIMLIKAKITYAKNVDMRLFLFFDLRDIWNHIWKPNSIVTSVIWAAKQKNNWNIINWFIRESKYLVHFLDVMLHLHDKMMLENILKIRIWWKIWNINAPNVVKDFISQPNSKCM